MCRDTTSNDLHRDAAPIDLCRDTTSNDLHRDAAPIDLCRDTVPIDLYSDAVPIAAPTDLCSDATRGCATPAVCTRLCNFNSCSVCARLTAIEWRHCDRTREECAIVIDPSSSFFIRINLFAIKFAGLFVALCDAAAFCGVGILCGVSFVTVKSGMYF